jgi:hypothetical protein
MSETIHPAQRLRRAEIVFSIASRRAAEWEKERSLCRRLSLRRFAALAGVLNLLEEASNICREVGTDARSPLATAIRDLHVKTRRQLRNVLAMYGVIIMATLVLGVIVDRESYMMSLHDSPIITEPKAGDAVDMTFTVSGPSPRGSLPPGTNLYVLVRSQGYDYWLQKSPKVGQSGWQAEGVGLGQPDEHGIKGRICAVLTRETPTLPLQLADTPAGDVHCINVTRR